MQNYAPRAELCAARGKKSLGARILHQLFEAFGLRYRDAVTEASQAIITAPFVVQLRIRTFLQLLDQTIVEHSLDGPVKRPRPKTHLSLAALVHLAHDLVTMPVLVRQRQEDMKHLRR